MKYHVAFSYASEDERYVQKVAEGLREKKIKVFFAPFESANLWGKNLSDIFFNTFFKQSDYCVMFISKHYARKVWPNQERQFAEAAVIFRYGIILPVRFDNTEIPGLPPTIGYINAANFTPPQIVEIITRKLQEKKINVLSVNTGNDIVENYFDGTETSLANYEQFKKAVTSDKVIDNKFLYWAVNGVQKYLALQQDPSYRLPTVSRTLLINNINLILKKIENNIDHIIDFGPGDGTEATIILRSIFATNNKRESVKCSIVDFSYHMLREAARTINRYKSSTSGYIDLQSINSDFRKINSYSQKLSGENRLFCLLGGTLGNYKETDILTPLVIEMNQNDFILLGADLLANRTKQQLENEYNSTPNKDFILNPLQDTGLQDIGLEFDMFDYACKCQAGFSEVSNSLTICAHAEDVSNKILMGLSTKYKKDSLIRFLNRRLKLKVVDHVAAREGYGLFLLTKK